jgi:hypothetical protein
METRDEQGWIQHQYVLKEGWEYSAGVETDTTVEPWHAGIYEKTRPAGTGRVTVQTRCDGQVKPMEIDLSWPWDATKMQEEMRRHWKVSHQRAEMVMRKNGVQQWAFRVVSEWEYELRVNWGVYGGGTSGRGANKGGNWDEFEV